MHYLHQTVADSKDDRVLEDGYLLGIVTGNLEAAAHIKLHRAKLNRFFSFGGYGSDSTDRGELTRTALQRAALVYGAPLSPEQCIVVGDTPHDVEGAQSAGIVCVGCFPTPGAIVRKIGSRCFTTAFSPPIIRQNQRSSPNTPPLVPQST